MKNSLQALSTSMLKALAIPVVVLLCLNTTLPGNQSAKAAGSGESLFTANCAVCHKAGGNIMNAKKPVIGSAKLANKQTFKGYLLKPTAPMQPAPVIANNDADLTALYDYCKSLK
jgi:mono/diheme cytochrome c family protein